MRQIERPVTYIGKPGHNGGSSPSPEQFGESGMILRPSQMIGRSVFWRFCQYPCEMNDNTKIAAASFSRGGIRASRDRHRHSVHAADADVFEGDDHEPSPDRRAAQLEQCERCALRDFNLAAANGFLQQAADDPRISDNQLWRWARRKIRVLHHCTQSIELLRWIPGPSAVRRMAASVV